MDGINTYVVSKAVKEAGVTVSSIWAGRRRIVWWLSELSPSVDSSIDKSFGQTPAEGGCRLLDSEHKTDPRRRDKFWQLAAGDGSAASVYSISRQLFSDETVNSLSAAGDNGVGVATSFKRSYGHFQRDLKARVGRLHGEYVVAGH